MRRPGRWLFAATSAISLLLCLAGMGMCLAPGHMIFREEYNEHSREDTAMVFVWDVHEFVLAGRWKHFWTASNVIPGGGPAANKGWRLDPVATRLPISIFGFPQPELGILPVNYQREQFNEGGSAIAYYRGWALAVHLWFASIATAILPVAWLVKHGRDKRRGALRGFTVIEPGSVPEDGKDA